jgi:dolichol-phosphate mannosyltransferase
MANAHPPVAVDDRGWELPASETHEFAPRSRSYCVCIPVINEGERIVNQLRRIQNARIQDRADVIIADGGSKDGSTEPEKLKPLGVRTLLIKRGPGKLSAQLRMAYAYALRQGYEGVITIDGNGKDGVEAILSFVDHLEAGWDLLQGSRYVPGGQAVRTPLMRRIGIKVLHVPLTRVASGFKYTDTTNGFRGYSRRFLLDPRVQPFRDVFQTYELLAYLSIRGPQLGMRVKELPVSRVYPESGPTPTKISGISGNLALVQILMNAATGKYNPT